MNMLIEWKYPDEKKLHIRTHYDVDPLSIKIENNSLIFQSIGEPGHCIYPLSHIVSVRTEEEE